MTEYKDIIDAERIRLQEEAEAREWAKGVKHLHYNGWIEEIKFNNGDTRCKDIRKNGKSWTISANLPIKKLVRKMKAG